MKIVIRRLGYFKRKKEIAKRKRVAKFMMNHATDSYFYWIRKK